MQINVIFKQNIESRDELKRYKWLKNIKGNRNVEEFFYCL